MNNNNIRLVYLEIPISESASFFEKILTASSCGECDIRVKRNIASSICEFSLNFKFPGWKNEFLYQLKDGQFIRWARYVVG
ncbi:MAG: hypothetical protein UT05_C0009G0025 [Parcubacteria group bacterium GW2011_GWF2_38_76]|nr:MAG: hypothetical protein UT05_C0009G0025 [Parcubacteria group bacterium GW2011_GWF2_38_76]